MRRIGELYPGPQMLLHVARALEPVFADDSRPAMYMREKDGAMGASGHTWATPGDTLASTRALHKLIPCIMYPLRSRDPWAHQPVVESRLFEGLPDTQAQFQEEYLTANDLWYQLRVTLYEGDRFLGFVGVYRPRDARAFGRREAALLSHFVPRLHEVMEVADLFHGQALDAPGVTAVLDALDRPAFLTTGRGRVVHANALARTLHPRAPAWLAPLVREGDRAHPAATLHPIRAAGTDLFLVQPRITTHPHPGIEHLPPSLRRVAELMAKGLTDKEIAQALNLPLATARTYAHRTLRRLQVDDRRKLILTGGRGAR